MYWGWFSWEQWAALLSALRHPTLRYSCLLLAAPLAWAGRMVLPEQLPTLQAADLVRTDLGPVAAGLFLSLAGIAAALAYLLGTLAQLAGTAETGRRVAIPTFLLQLGLGLGVGAVTLVIAGRALSWVTASCLVLTVCGGFWEVNRRLPTPGGPTGTSAPPPPGAGGSGEEGSIFDHWEP